MRILSKYVALFHVIIFEGRKTTVRVVSGEAFGRAWKQMTVERINSRPYFDENLINQTVFIQYNNFTDTDRNLALDIFTQLRIYEVTDSKRGHVFAGFYTATGNHDVNEISSDVWALNLMVDFCDVIHIYGMEDGASCSGPKRNKFENLPRYYFEDSPLLCDNKTSDKDILIEERNYFYNIFSSSSNIVFNAPKWQ